MAGAKIVADSKLVEGSELVVGSEINVGCCRTMEKMRGGGES